MARSGYYVRIYNAKNDTHKHYNTLEKAAAVLGMNPKRLMTEHVRSKFRLLNSMYEITITPKAITTIVVCLVTDTRTTYNVVGDVVIATGVCYDTVREIVTNGESRLIAGYIIGVNPEDVDKLIKENNATGRQHAFIRKTKLGKPRVLGGYTYIIKCLITGKVSTFDNHRELSEYVCETRPHHKVHRTTVTTAIKASRFTGESVLVRGYMMKAERSYDWVYPSMDDCVLNLRGLGKRGKHLKYYNKVTDARLIVRTGEPVRELIYDEHGVTLPRGPIDEIMTAAEGEGYLLERLPNIVDSELLQEIISGELKIYGETYVY